MLAIPSSEFGGQELPTADKIKKFVSGYGFPRDNFTLLEKSSMNGANMHPLVAIGKAKFPGDTSWNFADKYVFDRDGEVAARTKGIPDTLEAFKPLLQKKSIFEADSSAVSSPAHKKSKTKDPATVSISIQWCGG